MKLFDVVDTFGFLRLGVLELIVAQYDDEHRAAEANADADHVEGESIAATPVHDVSYITYQLHMD